MEERYAVCIMQNIFCISENRCVCGKVRDFEAYCSGWMDETYPWCYLQGGLKSGHCPGAVKSNNLDHYWTKHPDVCKGRF